MEFELSKLTQIQTALLALEGVEDCAVIARKAGSSNRELIAYVAGRAARATNGLLERLRGVLGPELCPADIVGVSAIPLAADGAVDEARLERIPVIGDVELRSWRAVIQRDYGFEPSSIEVRARVIPTSGLAVEAGVSPVAAVSPATQSGAPSIVDGGHLRTENLPQNLPEVLRRAIDACPANWVHCFRTDGSERRISWCNLERAAQCVLAGLRARGVKPGDKVILQCAELDETLISFWACQLGGFVSAPVGLVAAFSQETAAGAKLRNVCAITGHSLVIASSHSAPLMESWMREHRTDADVVGFDELRAFAPDENRHVSQPDDFAMLLFTSGSTGTPKGVGHTHRTMISHAAASEQKYRFTHRQVQLNWFPLDHVGGIQMSHVQGAFIANCQVHAPSELVLRDPLMWLDLIHRFRATWTWAPNFAFALVNNRLQEYDLESKGRAWDLSCVRFIVNGGEAVVARTARTFLDLAGRFGLRRDSMRPTWGMSETCSGSIYAECLRPDTDDAPAVEVGAPLPGLHLRIVGSAGAVVNEGTTGRLQIRGACITPGYFASPALNAEAFTQDGWFETGDLAVIADGQLTITGRSKDVVIINSANFHSHDIESAVDEVPGVDVSFTAACGVREAGADSEKLCIFFHPLLNDPASLHDLVHRIRVRVFACTGAFPTFVVPLEREEIPKTNIGKIQRSQLKADFEAGCFRHRLTAGASSSRRQPRRIGVHSVEWIPRAASNGSTLSGHRVLIFGDASPFTSLVQAALESRGAECDVISPGSGLERYSARPHFIAYLRALQPSADCGEESCHALAGVASQLALNPAFEDIQMVVATQGAVCASGSDQPYPPAGALAGLIRSIAAGSRFACRQVDMDSVDARSACLFAGELASERRDVQVAWRGDRRFIPSLVQIDPQQAPESEGIAEGGLYLLTGGLGGIGVHLSRFLLERYRACLIVTGRSELAAHPSRADAMHELEQLGGELTYRTADVTDLGAMRRIVESAERRCGRTLDGIFHLAGDTGMNDPWAERDGPESIDSLAAVFKPKAHGTETLAKIVAERPQTRLILFSSVSAVFGLGSFWGYSAANSFVDLVAARLRNRFGIRVQAIDWSMWEGVGMSALASSAAREAARALGYQTLSPAEALAALDFCLRTPLSRILVGLDSANPKIFALMRREAEPLEQVSIAASGTEWSADRIAFQDRFGTPVECILETDGGAPPTMLEEAPASETEQHVAAFIRDLLGVPRVNRRDSFFLLGGDSLAAMRLLNRIEQRWGVRVSLRQMAENPTAEGIAQAIEKHALSAPVSSNEAERLLENIDQLDDSQIEGLLARLASATS